MANFPGGADSLPTNITPATPEVGVHASLHNKTSDAVNAIETALLPGGTTATAIAGKAAAVHTHVEGDVTSLTTDLAGKAASVHTHLEGDVTSLTTDLAAREQTANKNVANGYAGLDATGNVPASELANASSVSPAANSITTAMIQNVAVTAAKMAAGAATGVVLGADVVTNTAAVTVSVNRSSITYSQYQPGATLTNLNGYNHLDLPFGGNDAPSVMAARGLVADANRFCNIHIMDWGRGDPWPAPVTAPNDPTTDTANWNAWTATMDAEVYMVRALGLEPVITLCEAPWWLKGQLQSDGTTKLIPDVNGENAAHTYTSGITDFRSVVFPANYVSPDPFASRVLDNKIGTPGASPTVGTWCMLVHKIVQRYAASPYNVRYFQVWNELKGYSDVWTATGTQRSGLPGALAVTNLFNQYDYDLCQGDTAGANGYTGGAGYNAKHGYTWFYQQTRAQIRASFPTVNDVNGHALDATQALIGGPYDVVATWTDSGAGGFATAEVGLSGNKGYGYWDDRHLQPLKFFLQHGPGAEFIAMEIQVFNVDFVASSYFASGFDVFSSAQKTQDFMTWLRGLNNTTYPGAATLPVWLSEFYSNPNGFNANTDPVVNSAAQTNHYMTAIKAGFSGVLLWDEVGDASGIADGPMTFATATNVAGGGQPSRWYPAAQALREWFSAGRPLYATTISDTTKVYALATNGAVMLVNRTNASVTVSVDSGQALSMAAYETRLVPVGV